MEPQHRKLIEKHFSALVEQTSLTALLPLLVERGVFPSKMAEPYADNRTDIQARKTQLYLDIQRRGPKAFDHLVNALWEISHWDLVRMLKQDHPLNNTTYISLKKHVTPSNSHQSGQQGGNSTTILRESQNITNTTHETKVIKVKKAETFGKPAEDKIMCYSMKSKNRGLFFMINNIFNGIQNKFREGAVCDQNNLDELFKQIGFPKRHIHQNLTAKMMEEELEHLSNSEDLKHTDSLFIVIGSHGIEKNGEDCIEGIDHEVLAVNKVIDMFNGKNCPNAQGIPKVFIFQLCRGTDVDKGCNSRIQTDGKPQNVKMSTTSDLVIAHSTLPKHAAFRDSVFGSWYISAICDVIENHAHDTHLHDLFILISNKMRDSFGLGDLQTPTVEYRGFLKHCYLNPGLHE